jgi:hypothetical protein
LADEQRSPNVPATNASALALDVAFISLHDRASLIDSSLSKGTHTLAIKAVKNASSQSQPGRASSLGCPALVRPANGNELRF